MRNIDRQDVLIQRLLRAARTVAVVEPGARAGDPGRVVFDHLRRAGVDAVPIRRDRQPVDRIASFARLADVPGQVDIVVVFGDQRRGAGVVDDAAAKRVEALWLPPGRASRVLRERATALGLTVVEERDIVAALRDMNRDAGNPVKRGVHLRRRKGRYEDNRRRPGDGGWQEAGGGGRKGGGGGRAVLDEKKMVKGRPSRRRGPFKRRIA